MPKYYPINEEAAKRAKDMNSFSDYQPGSATTSYRAMVDEAYAAAERQKARVDPMYHDKIDALVDLYARKLAENLNERNVIDARVPSILISGGGNFPVAKKHKQNAARDRNYGEYSTQRPVDIGTFPKPPYNKPDEIFNYDQRIPVENGSFLAWGYLTYTRPLTEKQASDYELRPAPDNPDRPRPIAEQMKNAAKLAEADRGSEAPAPQRRQPDRGDR